MTEERRTRFAVTTASYKTLTAESKGGAVVIYIARRPWPHALVDRWMPELAPSAGLLADHLRFRRDPGWWHGRYVPRFLAEMSAASAEAALDHVRETAMRRPVTLVCHCADESRCHRSLVAGLVTSPPPARAADATEEDAMTDDEIRENARLRLREETAEMDIARLRSALLEVVLVTSNADPGPGGAARALDRARSIALRALSVDDELRSRRAAGKEAGDA